MESVLTLSQLIEKLLKANKHEYKSVFEEFKCNREDVIKFENWSPDTYVRNGIFKNDSFELILLCWEKGHETTIHCHDGEECWIYLIDGELEEVKYNKDEKDNLTKLSTYKLSKHQRSYITDAIGLHQLKNSHNGRTMSLHLYAKPILKCSYYDSLSQEFKNKELHYDTYNGKVITLEKELIS